MCTWPSTSCWSRSIRLSRCGLPALLAVLAGCAVPVEQVREDSPAPLPAASYVQAARQGARVYEIVPQDSLLLVRVGRAGRAQRLGHEHAVASETLAGFVELGDDPTTARADIAFALRELVVDKAEYREHFALDTEPSPDDIAGTYSNMLKVLEPSTYPWATIRALVLSVDGADLQLGASVTLHGATAEYLLPARIRIENDRLTADVSGTIRHSDFGVEPFSAMAGLLRVADELAIELHLVGRRLKRNQ